MQVGVRAVLDVKTAQVTDLQAANTGRVWATEAATSSVVRKHPVGGMGSWCQRNQGGRHTFFARREENTHSVSYAD